MMLRSSPFRFAVVAALLLLCLSSRIAVQASLHTRPHAGAAADIINSAAVTTAVRRSTHQKPAFRQKTVPTSNTSSTAEDKEQSQRPPHSAPKKKPLKILVMVEPSPLTYCSGYANRFKELFSHLKSTNDDVHIVTANDIAAPAHMKPNTWLGKFPVHHTQGMRLPHYPLMSISIDYTLKVVRLIMGSAKKPDLIHVSSPGTMMLAAVAYARIFQIPLVASYHTHLPVYVRSYLPKTLAISRIAESLTWVLIRLFHGLADLTVVTSPQIQSEFEQHGVPSQVWRKGIDTKRFHPKYATYPDPHMRSIMTNGNPNDFLIVYVGRLGKEKRLKELRDVVQRMQPNTRLCLVGGGPIQSELKEYFKDTPTVFMGHLDGDELSQSFACADVFVMPSDSETLGFVVLESMASGVPVVC